MEKKQNSRSNQVPAKVLTSEPRKSKQDSTGKQQTRNSRRREFSSNCLQAQKSDRSAYNGNHKQPQQQIFAPKSRGSDAKRLNRNGYNSSRHDDASGTSSSSTGARLSRCDDSIEKINTDFEIELNSVYLPGSKKQNLNHLLNFNYAPRDRTDATTFTRTGNISKYHANVRRVKYNKEQFLQANCQFVVKSNGDYAPYMISPDMLVEWSSIEQIHFFGSTEEPQCPICLYHPVAAKMTRCGHVYCWPCILHYLALSEKKSWRKCPICYEAVHIGDLKSAVSKPHRNFVCDESVTFQLMCRSKNSLQIYKADATPAIIKSMAQYPHFSAHQDELNHRKLVLARPHEILSIIERERNELRCQLVSDGIDCPDSIFVQQALHLLEERENIIRVQCDNGGYDEPKEVGLAEAFDAITLNAEAKEFRPSEVNDDAHSSTTQSDLDDILSDCNLTLNDIDMPANAVASNPDSFYFYQSSDGQHLYLHSINIRMLQAMYGALEFAPKTIAGHIVQKESCSMTEELRKRLKYLQHLPITCQFDVVEIELKAPNIISDEVFSKFKDELAQRQRNRQQRAREERKREAHIDRENDRRIGKIIHTAINIDVTSEQQFPSCGSFDESFFPLHGSSQGSANGATVNDGASVSNPGPSFAKMLTSPTGTKSADKWPKLGRPKEMPLFAQTESQSVTASEFSMASHGNHSDEGSMDLATDDVETAYARPEFKESFGSAIAEALNKAAHSKHPRKPQREANDRPAACKKQRKSKNTVLFSTGGRTFDGN